MGFLPLPRALSARGEGNGWCGAGSLRTTATILEVATPINLLFPGADHHGHLPPFHARELIDDAELRDVVLDAMGQFHPQFLVPHFAAAEADVALALVAFLDEPLQVAQLDVVIAN